MKTTPILILLILFFTSCGPDNSEQVDQQIDVKKLTHEIIDDLSKRAVKDTGVTTRTKNNKFTNDLSTASIDKKFTKLIEGSWQLSSNGSMEFLQTKFDEKDTAVFNDSHTRVMTAWGEIQYNTSAKFYFTTGGSYMYEYYITPDKQLVLTQFDYYNEDLTFKDRPTLITATYSISFTDNNNIVLFNEFQKFLLERIKNYH